MNNIQQVRGSSIKRVIVIGADALGRVTAQTVAKGGRGRTKKRTRSLKLIERMIRHTTAGNAEAWREYRRLHYKSATKRRDGALRDYPVNMLRATARGIRQARLPRFFW